MTFYTVHTASWQKPMALAESTVNPQTTGQEDGLCNSLSTVLPRELSASVCSAYNGKAVAFLTISLTELFQILGWMLVSGLRVLFSLDLCNIRNMIRIDAIFGCSPAIFNREYVAYSLLN